MSNTKPDISNLKGLIEDAKKAFLDNDDGPEDPTDYSQLRGRLEASRNKLPPLYRKIDVEPYIRTLDELGETGFVSILLRDPTKQRVAGIMLDIAQAILQKGEKYKEIAIDAFEEVVSDLYDGFLSAEDRRGVNPPDKETIPPLVKFSNYRAGPYTYPVNATSIFGCQTGIVSLPPSHTRLALIGWAALGHETCGHDILHADTGMFGELITAVQTGLEQQGIKDGLPEYWSTRIDETASDCLGILNMGPMAGMAVLGYFRALNLAFTGVPKLSNEGGTDEHPADILRGYLAASTVGLLSFKEANSWAQTIESETNKDLTTIVLEDTKIDAEIAKQSAKIVASTICTTKLKSIENHSFIEIQDWHDSDQEIVNQLIAIMTTANPLPSTLAAGIYAAHAVAAAIEAALAKDADIPSIFGRMLAILKMMHDKNSAWGPLFMTHRGNAFRDYFSRFFDPESYGQIEIRDTKSLRYK